MKSSSSSSARARGTRPTSDVHEAKNRGDNPREAKEAPPPAAGSRQVRDEDFATTDQPVLPDTKTARALQAHPPTGEDQLDVGTGGDAARPGKEGTAGKPIPRRGDM